MALDEALLDAVAADPSTALLRTYGWTEPTLSLGYFQSVADAETDSRWCHLPVVRRMTGGGAIWHHHEVTYALVLPGAHPLARPSPVLYHAVHTALAAMLRRHGVDAAPRGPQSPPATAQRPFLCFTDRAPEDLVTQGAKILGSAQRRRSGAILQHGSLLLMRSPVTPELPGVGDLSPVSTDPRDWSSLVAAAIPPALGIVALHDDIAPQLRQNARHIETAIYRNDAWFRRR